MSQKEDTDGITPEQLVTKYQNLLSQTNIKALEDINKIDWSNFHHAHGEAVDFPPLFLATFSSNQRDREFSLKLLFETIWHQGTVYEASAYAVPFLFKALESPETPDKAVIAMLLACLADGHSYLDVHALSDDKSEKIWREILTKKNRELEVEVAREIAHVAATRKAVGKGLHLLYPYLRDENVSSVVAKALAFYPEHKADVIPLLESALASINDKFAKEEIQSTLEKLRVSSES
jgi:hypothetical protein